MILYSVVPPELVLEGFEENKPVYEEISGPEGAVIQVERLENGRKRIVRLISSNPDHYLNPQYQPGTII